MFKMASFTKMTVNTTEGAHMARWGKGINFTTILKRMRGLKKYFAALISRCGTQKMRRKMNVEI